VEAVGWIRRGRINGTERYSSHLGVCRGGPEEAEEAGGLGALGFVAVGCVDF
jgi:hypothetical protein